MSVSVSRQDVALAIQDTFGSINRERPPEEQIDVNEDTLVQADDSQLDSVEFVAFVTELEQRLLDMTGVSFGLVGDAREGAANPLRSVRSLTDHILRRLND